MKRWIGIVPVILAAAIYIQTCWGEYVWDDAIVIHRQLIAFKSVGQVLLPPANIPQWAQNYYRPVVVFTYMLDNLLFESNEPAGRHGTNIIIFTVITFLVWIFSFQCLQKLPYGHWGAVTAATIFAVHPIHTESISWITGRSDPVAAMFMMAALVTAHHYWTRRKTWALAASPVFYFLALLSKEVAVSALLVLPFVFFLTPFREKNTVIKNPAHTLKKQRKKKKKERPIAPSDHKETEGGARSLFILYVPCLLATAVYFFLRQKALVGHGTSLGLGMDDLFMRGWRAMAYYVWKIIVPLPQLHFVSLNALPSPLVSTLILITTVTIVGISIWRWEKGRPIIGFSLAWMACTLAPSLPVALAKISETPVAERYLFVPSVGFALLLGGILCLAMTRPDLKRVFIGGIVFIVGLYGAGTIHRNMAWQDNVRLWSDATRKSPNQGLPWTELGMAYNARKEVKKALSCFEKAITVDYDREGRSIAHNNLGMIYLRQGDLEKAENHFRTATKERKSYATPHYGLGLIGLERVKHPLSLSDARNHIKKSILSFEEAIARNPNYVKAFWGLIRASSVMGDIVQKEKTGETSRRYYENALKNYERLLRIDPTFPVKHPKKAAFIQKLKKNITGKS